MLGHITTFGGHPLPCAAGNAALNLLKEIDYREVDKKGAYLRKKLSENPNVKAVRQIGLMLAVDLNTPEDVQQVFNYCLENGVIIFWFLSCPSSFRLAPPLNISWEDLEKGIAIILQGVNKI